MKMHHKKGDEGGSHSRAHSQATATKISFHTSFSLAFKMRRSLLSRCSESFSVPITAVATSLSVGPVVKTKVESATGARARIRPSARAPALPGRMQLGGRRVGVRACQRATYFAASADKSSDGGESIKISCCCRCTGRYFAALEPARRH